MSSVSDKFRNFCGFMVSWMDRSALHDSLANRPESLAVLRDVYVQLQKCASSLVLLRAAKWVTQQLREAAGPDGEAEAKRLYAAWDDAWANDADEELVKHREWKDAAMAWLAAYEERTPAAPSEIDGSPPTEESVRAYEAMRIGVRAACASVECALRTGSPERKREARAERVHIAKFVRYAAFFLVAFKDTPQTAAASARQTL